MPLEVRNIRKAFGDHSVLNGVSFRADSGSALGLLGRNGAGKTTTIRIIMDVFPPDEGSVHYNGQPLGRAGIRIGYLPEERGLYPKLPIGRQLLYLARLRGLSTADAKKSVEHWLTRLDMADTADKKLETLSRGNQQKIQLALALLADPDVIILDEPFSGLDPVNAQLLKDIVNEQVADGKTVLFSSHQMGYIEQFCDDVALLSGGTITVSGRLRDIKRSYPRTRLSVLLPGPDGTTARILHQVSETPGLASRIRDMDTNPDDGECIVRLNVPEDREPLLKALMASGHCPEVFSVLEPTLEQIFIENAGGGV